MIINWLTGILVYILLFILVLSMIIRNEKNNNPYKESLFPKIVLLIGKSLMYSFIVLGLLFFLCAISVDTIYPEKEHQKDRYLLYKHVDGNTIFFWVTRNITINRSSMDYVIYPLRYSVHGGTSQQTEKNYKLASGEIRYDIPEINVYFTKGPKKIKVKGKTGETLWVIDNAQ